MMSEIFNTTKVNKTHQVRIIQENCTSVSDILQLWHQIQEIYVVYVTNRFSGLGAVFRVDTCGAGQYG